MFKFKSLREATLGGNQWSDEATRFQWTPEDITKESFKTTVKYKEGDLNIIIKPMEIKTFVFYI